MKAVADRIDKSKDGKECIAVDYKSKDKGLDIEKLIFTESSLQPPIYLEILNKEDNQILCSSAELAFITHKVKNHTRVLSLEKFNTIKNKFTALLSFLGNLAQKGIYPIYREDKEHCNFCDFKDICRKNHLPTAKRSRKSNYFKELRNFHYVPSRPKR